MSMCVNVGVWKLDLSRVIPTLASLRFRACSVQQERTHAVTVGMGQCSPGSRTSAFFDT